MNFKKYLGTLTLSLFLLFSPIQAQANTGDSEYREILFNLIAVLKEQVSLLQAEQGKKLTIEKIDSAENSLFQPLVDVTAKYKISEPEDVEEIKDKKQRKHFTQFFDLLPDKYDKKFSQLIVFAGEALEFDAFVETTSDEQQKWTYAISSDILEFPDFYADTELMIHELGHVVSSEYVSDKYSDEIVCSFYLDEEYCYSVNSYLGQFAKKFWRDVDSKRLEDHLEYYKENQTDFVSDYAATNPDEDFSETFMFFVLDRPTDKEGAGNRIDFFSDYSEIVLLKNQIQDEMKKLKRI